MPEKIVTNHQAFYDFLGVERDIDRLSRQVYKATACGAWAQETDTGFKVGSIVEGVDQCTEIHFLNFPFEYKAFWEALDDVEAEAKEIWDMTHGCDDCGPEDPYTGNRPINPNCKTCKGEGAII